MPASTASASSPRCAPFPCRRVATAARNRGPPGPSAAPAAHGCGGRPLGRAAGAVGGGIAAAFFASLERCSCVEVRTKDDDDNVDAEAAPLMMRRGGSPPAAAAGRKKAGKRRGSLGCCENSSAVN